MTSAARCSVVRSVGVSPRPGPPPAGFLAEVHERHDHNSLSFFFDAIHDSVREAMEAVAPVSFVQRLPRFWMSEDLLKPCAELVNHLATECSALRLVVFESLLQVILRFIEDDRRHWRALLSRRFKTSSTGFAPVFPATNSASRRCTSVSHAASIASD